MRSFKDGLDAHRYEVAVGPMLPTIGWTLRRGDMWECRMSWEGVITVTAHGRSRTEASGNAAALFRAACWFVTRREVRA